MYASAGYAFLLFREESSVHKLLLSCMQEGNKYFLYIPTSVLGSKKVSLMEQIPYS